MRDWHEARGLAQPETHALHIDRSETILEEAQRITHGARNADYGHPLEDFSRTAKIWTAILDKEVTPQQVALCMIGVKISRECHRPKRDNAVDIAGYAGSLDRVNERLGAY